MESYIKKILLLSLISHLLISVGTSGSNGLTAITECICPGYNVVYQCTVTGGLFTVWGGTALPCTGGSITLRHSDFESVSSPAVQECNRGQIVIIGRGISQQGNCYTSQINITFTEGLVGETVTCGIDGASPASVHSVVLATSTRTSMLAPSNFSMNVTPRTVTFRWEPVYDCPGLYYNVMSMTNCGTCPSGTEVSQIACSDFSIPANGVDCMLTIQTVLCMGTTVAVSGGTSSVSLFLKVPDAPELYAVPFYKDGELMGISISISKSRFSLSDSVDGSPTSFTIKYADTNGDSCSSPTTILANSTACVDNLCTHYFTGICCSSLQTVITAYGTNVLGNGSDSIKRISHRSSGFVIIGVSFTPTSKKVTCSFQGPTDVIFNGEKMCNISIANGLNCQGSRRGSRISTAVSGDDIQLNLNDLISDADEGESFCYNLTARADTERVVLQSTFDVVIIVDEDAGINVVAAIIVPIIVTLIVVLVTLIVVLLVDQQVYRTGYFVQKVFVDKYGKVLPREERLFGFRSHKWSVFVPTTGNKTLHEGDEFLYCPDANVKEYRYVPEEDQNVPEGVNEVKNWQYIYKHSCPTPPARHLSFNRLGDLITTGIEEQKVFHEEYYDIDQEKGSKPPADQIPKRVTVMAMREDGKWFEDTNKMLLKDSDYNHDKSIFQPPLGWKHLFFLSQGVRVLADGDKALFNDPSLLAVSERYNWKIVTVTTEKSLEEFISTTLGISEPKRTLKHIYIQKQPGQHEIEDSDIIMALDKDNQLCAGTGANRLIRSDDYDTVWQIIFVQVDSYDTPLFREGTKVLHCKYEFKQ